MYYIDKDFLGSKEHIIVMDGEPKGTSSSVPALALIENGTSEPGTLQSFLQMCDVSRTLIPAEIERSLDVCKILPEVAGLSYLIRKEDLALELASFCSDVERPLSKVIDYLPFYLKNIATLNSCSRLKFSRRFGDVSLDTGGFAECVRYDTTRTKTGRMSVVSGPNVLTMQKDFKSALTSRFSNGKIIEIDYSALEPRVALAIAGSSIANSADVYSELGKTIKINDREVAKQLIISFLYGAGISTMQRLTGIKASDLQSRLLDVKKMFRQDELIEKIRVQLQVAGSFKNHAGRIIFPGSDKPGLLFNNYCQSSAVDVALSGFSSLLGEIKDGSMQTVPLCFIHDAILLDVPSCEIDRIMKISKQLHTYLGVDFPTKLTIIND